MANCGCETSKTCACGQECSCDNCPDKRRGHLCRARMRCDARSLGFYGAAVLTRTPENQVFG
ncbi:hypothetical protein GGTG_05980 [Gaeumannomyces tritici R3-111a-1]|uniref:Uncharacterized protein n=1 Tax=Gaeumannomyces tritici (strain R3-111a-1) TaxID=644352 RepID=J3NXH4_GAET3|nr:hypothetical protein GGTG_05980 [Gaeumannomyces tritici R3-111a-1]EJT76056.1 hypothetical protein GGTG_05980 [Gaeumannomyces tritici R3-111a-1]